MGRALARLGLAPLEEVRTDDGLSLDFTVTYAGTSVGVEVDGPHHFHGGSTAPTAITVFKRRQLRRLGVRLLPVPYWEWNECAAAADDAEGRQRRQREYLASALAQLVSEGGPDEQSMETAELCGELPQQAPWRGCEAADEHADESD